MSIDPLDRLHNQQPVPGQDQNPVQAPDPDFDTDNPDVQDPDGGDRPGIGPDIKEPGEPDLDDPNEPGLGNPIP